MATENRVLDLSFPAAEDISDYQYHFVVLTATQTIRLHDTASEVSLGILQNAPDIGEAAVVRVIGVSKFVCNGVLAIGTFIGPEYVGAADAGKGKDNSASPAYARGIVIEGTSAEDDVGSVLLSPMHAPVAAIGATDITLAEGKIVIGQTGGAGDAKTPSGDITITSAGVTAIGAAKVAKAKLKYIVATMTVASNASSLSVTSASFTSGVPLGFTPVLAVLGATALRVTKIALAASTLKVSLSGATTHTGAAVITVPILRN
jgi:hypothetical protein